MFSKLKLASLYTLLLLSGMLFAVLASIFYFLGYFDAWVMVGLTILVNFIIWLTAPFFIDLQHRFFYKMRFLSTDEFAKECPELYVFIKAVCEKHGLKFPKMRMVDDMNPTAYTYGSGRYNARIAISKGLLSFLSQQEVRAVVAHELGHIIHRDFIVMSVANTMLQILYQIYIVCAKRGRGTKRGKKDALKIVGIVAYFFYTIGTYLILYLSRIREYSADAFAVRESKDPNCLSVALIKIAYGITSTGQKNSRLIESTKTMGILSLNNAKAVLPVISNQTLEPAKVAKVLLFDLVNPWAKLLELSSTHPLIGKRLQKLDKIAAKKGQNQLFDMENVLASMPIDKKRLYHGFVRDCFINYLTVLLIVPIAVVFAIVQNVDILIVVPAVFGIGMLVKVLYRFSTKQEPVQTTVLDLMSDIYASPVRGKFVKLDGKIIGRGVAGYRFSEDMMYQDSTGLIYFDYKSGVPLLGNLFFAWRKVKKLIGMRAQASGWFVRGMTKSIVLQHLQTQKKTFNSYPRLYALLGCVGLIVVSAVLFVVISQEI